MSRKPSLSRTRQPSSHSILMPTEYLPVNTPYICRSSHFGRSLCGVLKHTPLPDNPPSIQFLHFCVSWFFCSCFMVISVSSYEPLSGIIGRKKQKCQWNFSKKKRASFRSPLCDALSSVHTGVFRPPTRPPAPGIPESGPGREVRGRSRRWPPSPRRHG